MKLHEHWNLNCIEYSHVTKYSPFNFLNYSYMQKPVFLSFWTAQKPAVGQIWSSGCHLLTPASYQRFQGNLASSCYMFGLYTMFKKKAFVSICRFRMFFRRNHFIPHLKSEDLKTLGNCSPLAVIRLVLSKWPVLCQCTTGYSPQVFHPVPHSHYLPGLLQVCKLMALFNTIPNISLKFSLSSVPVNVLD